MFIKLAKKGTISHLANGTSTLQLYGQVSGATHHWSLVVQYTKLLANVT